MQSMVLFTSNILPPDITMKYVLHFPNSTHGNLPYIQLISTSHKLQDQWRGTCRSRQWGLFQRQNKQVVRENRGIGHRLRKHRRSLGPHADHQPIDFDALLRAPRHSLSDQSGKHVSRALDLGTLLLLSMLGPHVIAHSRRRSIESPRTWLARWISSSVSMEKSFINSSCTPSTRRKPCPSYVA